MKDRSGGPPAMNDQHTTMEIDLVERDDVVILVVQGELDLSVAPDFTAWLARAEASPAPAIVVDLDRVSFMDSSGMHALLQFSLSERNRERLGVTRGSPQVQRLLEITGLTRYLSFVPSPGLGSRL
jgi:anti-anti-sigma factor